ncbi:hypothetical protein [Streptomyces sp. NPDC088785]|uniref:hypothetical protein n=1 Tax=Streptomyces sp. NPDC088785 TaxID=3365897 RepID=UPI0038271347
MADERPDRRETGEGCAEGVSERPEGGLKEAEPFGEGAADGGEGRGDRGEPGAQRVDQAGERGPQRGEDRGERGRDGPDLGDQRREDRAELRGDRGDRREDVPDGRLACGAGDELPESPGDRLDVVEQAAARSVRRLEDAGEDVADVRRDPAELPESRERALDPGDGLPRVGDPGEERIDLVGRSGDSRPEPCPERLGDRRGDVEEALGERSNSRVELADRGALVPPMTCRIALNAAGVWAKRSAESAALPNSVPTPARSVFSGSRAVIAPLTWSANWLKNAC